MQPFAQIFMIFILTLNFELENCRWYLGSDL